MSNESIARVLVGLSNARQEVTETAVNYLLGIKLLAIRAFPDNKRVADSITLKVFKQGLQTQNSYISRARSIEKILNVIEIIIIEDLYQIDMEIAGRITRITEFCGFRGRW